MPPVRSRAWTFTINNYTDECCKEMDALLAAPEVHRLIGGFEVGEEGTPHIQGAVYFRTLKSFKQLKKMLTRAHIEKCFEDWRTQVRYCSKECNVKWAKNEKGGQGERTDFKDAMAKVYKTDTVRAWCFTLNNYTDEDFKKMSDLVDDSSVNRLIGGFEIAPTTGTPHIQGAIVFRSKRALGGVRKLLPRAMWSNMEKKWPAQVKYCSKECKVEWRKNTEGGQGERTDIKEAIKMIKEGADFADVCRKHEAFVRCAGAYKLIREQKVKKSPPPKERPMKVTILWGPAGTGKTTKAMEGDSVYVWDARNRFFNQYDGQKKLVIDEFKDNQTDIKWLARIIDKFRLVIEVKGGSAWAEWEEVVITSKVDPQKWYLGCEDVHRRGLLRRVDEIIEMNTRAGDTPTHT